MESCAKLSCAMERSLCNYQAYRLDDQQATLEFVCTADDMRRYGFGDAAPDGACVPCNTVCTLRMCVQALAS
jgi:hypothetical protein